MCIFTTIYVCMFVYIIIFDRDRQRQADTQNRQLTQGVVVCYPGWH